MVYEYKCEKCGHVWEESGKSADDRTSECQKPVKQTSPVCGGVGVRQISATSFRLKGPGWANENYGTTAKK